MNLPDRNLVITVGVVIAVIVGGYAGLAAYTGSWSPFSVVMSQSMQHDNYQSEVGVIDTGDVVIVREPDKATIYSYVEGTQNGYTSFGDYGSVIIYHRSDTQNPVIHRAILWLDYVDGRWSAPSLENYSGTWYCQTSGTYGWNNLSGTLVMEDVTGSSRVYIDLNSLPRTSGYLTKGDNPVTNPNFDQSSYIIDHLIDYDDIRSVPVMEIPWLGVLKILVYNGGNNLDHVPNSLPSFAMCFITIFGFLILIDVVSIFKNAQRAKERLEWINKVKR